MDPMGTYQQFFCLDTYESNDVQALTIPDPERLLDTMRQSSYTIVPIEDLPGKKWQAVT